MAKIRPFKGLRPPKELIELVSSRPYDVLNSEEARAEAADNEKSLYHIIKPEIDFPIGTDSRDPKVYKRAADNFQLFQDKGWLVQDNKPLYYIYAQTMNGKTQYGLVLAASVQDYLDGHIKRHELTRKEKEEDRMKNVLNCKANIGPAFLAYPDNKELDEMIARHAAQEPIYDFTPLDEGVRHTFWIIDQEKEIQLVTDAFAKIDALYIADGHHRTAAAALVCEEQKKKNPHHTGNEEYNYFMAVCFPADQLTIIDYNRVVSHLNGMTPSTFLHRLEEHFIVEKKGSTPYRPDALHLFGLYIEDTWYKLTAKPHTYNPDDPIAVLDVSVSSKYILHDLLGIEDLRTDDHIDFVGGIRGLKALAKRVDSGEMKLALALYPVSMKQLMDIADCGEIMPPKTTWFEPKLRSGVVIHKLED